MREHGTLHIPDVRAQNDFPVIGSVSGFRTFLAAPLRQQGELIGALNARRIEVRPFTPAQIKLLETFADQAVIAIENVRLFQELKESLEQQTATSEILGVIASSPTDIQPVLDVVAENAARLCDANDAIIVASMAIASSCGHYGSAAERWRDSTADRPWHLSGRAIIDRQTIQFRTWQQSSRLNFRMSRADQQASAFERLATPLLREGIPIGRS